MPRHFIYSVFFAIFTFLAPPIVSAETPSIIDRNCTDKITIGQPLCNPGRVDIVSKKFDLFAKARAIAVDPVLTTLPPTFMAYFFDFYDNPTKGWLAPPIFEVPQRFPESRASLGTIRFNLHNLLPSVLDNTFMINGRIPGGDQPLNLHTHGLVVLPHVADVTGAYGDFVGVLTCPAQTMTPKCPHDPHDLQMTQVCDATRLSAKGHPCNGISTLHEVHGISSHREHDRAWIHGHKVLLKPIPYAIEVPGAHPPSFAWFHPHAHEIASAQVGAGLAGVLTIGSLCSDPALADAARTAYCTTRDGAAVLNDKIKVRVMMLKDLEVFQDRQGRDSQTGSATPSTEGYRIVPTCQGSAIVLDGFCSFSRDDSTNLDGNWLFTINGQIKPTIKMQVGQPELWRIANVSSNATYRLSLCRDNPVPDAASDPKVATCSDFKSFQIISLDGGRTPHASTLDTEHEILLPPGARAEIIVQPEANEAFALVQKGFHQPDLYPPVIMAAISTGPSSATVPTQISFKPPAPRRISSSTAKFEEPDDCEHRPDVLGPNDWVSLKNRDEVVSVFFGKISADPEVLSLGLMRGNVEQSSDSEVRRHMQKCLENGIVDGFDCRFFKGSAFTMDYRNLCLKHGTKVTFRLYNLTDETHNFHIHQQKFNVDTPQMGITLDPSVAAVVGNAIQKQIAGSPTLGDAAPIVDSVPVPSIWIRGDATDPTKVTGHNPVESVTMQFDRPQQVGDFVFHCHILEHEDKGMMKRITVYTADKP